MASAAATSSAAAMVKSATDSSSRRVALITRSVQVPPPRSISTFFRRSGTIGAQARTPAYVASSSLVTAAMATEASAKVIDGKAVAKEIREEIAAEICKMREATGVVPGLAVILVGERKDSATYVRNKKKACESVGIKSYEVHLAEDSSEQEVLNYISNFNDDPSVNGILVQLPLPSHMNEQKVLNAVSLEKDVDGFNPLNIGRLAMRDREPLFVPCTPKGCIELLHRYGVPIKGKRAVVIGRSNIVGMPAALLLQREDATVSIVHSRTKNPEEITREADILIAAVGRPNMVKGSWIKPGSVIIDVGINPVEDATSPRGYRLVGDVCYEEGKKGIWIKIPIELVNLVEPAVKEGFYFHHAEPKYLMLVHWLANTANTLPANASHRVGVAAFVLNEKNEVLVVQENSGKFRGTDIWKYPTGVVDVGEDICAAAVREVKEETGVDSKFLEILAFRQSHKAYFEKSDLFFICMLQPLSLDIVLQEGELEGAKWMPHDEYVAQPFVQKHQLLRKIADICQAKKDKVYTGFSPVPTATPFTDQEAYMYINSRGLDILQ